MSAGAPESAPPASRIRIWDGQTRLGHWLLVGLLAFSWWSAETHRMDYHRYSGYTALGVLIFRIYWGFFGSSTARFAHFIKGPRSIWHYLKSRGRERCPGHNPLGALSVLALLGLLLAQVTLGLFTVDVDGLESGPLSHLVSFDTGRVCAEWHAVLFNVLLGFIAVHILAIVFYALVRRENLVQPMVTGWKKWHDASVPPVRWVSLWRAVPGIVLAAGLVWWIAR